jgi:hypothetical protein
MQGARSFSAMDYVTGNVAARYTNTKGEINYRYEESLRHYQAEQGRLMRMDVNPAVDKKSNFSLDALRNTSMGQIALDTLSNDYATEAQKGEFIRMLLIYGTAGLAFWGQNSKTLSRNRAVLEVVPPWEIQPIPARPASASALVGLMRVRWMRLSELEKMEGLNFKGARDKDTNDKPRMETQWFPMGSQPTMSGTNYGSSLDSVSPDISRESYAEGSLSNRVDRKDMEEEWAKVIEVFQHTPYNELSRYVVWVGGHIAADEKYVDDGKAELPQRPLYIARYIDTGSFYGRSMVELLYPTNLEVEYLMRRLFENAQQLDQMGILFLPNSSGIDVNQLKYTGRQRIAFYEPDLTTPEHRPFNIAPSNTGDWPGKVAQMGRGLLKDMAGQSDMLQGGAPGRVDSASALGFLEETSNIPMAPVANSIADAYSGIYAAMLQMARDNWTAETIAHITLLDDSLVGVVIDPDTGKVSLDKNSVPRPQDIKITVKAALPSSLQQRKSELLTMLQLQLVTPAEFRRISRSENMGFPLGSRAEYENFRKATLNNIVQFGDGKTPGLVIISPEADNPEIHLECILDFMARPEFMLATKTVRSAFEQRKRTYEQMLGRNFPDQLGYPEQEAQYQQGIEEQNASPEGQAAGMPQPDDEGMEGGQEEGFQAPQGY